MRQAGAGTAAGFGAARPEAYKRLVLRLRLFSGLTLLLFAFMHLCNLAFALRSLQALDAASVYLMGPWTSTSGSLLLLVASVSHAGMGLISIAQRRSLAMSRTDWVQMLLGIVTIPLLLSHVLVAGALKHLYPQFQPDYSFLLLLYWKYFPLQAVQQILLLVILWVHGAIGLYNWLVLKPVWTKVGPVLMPVLFLVPILALLGFVEGGRAALARLDAVPAWQEKVDRLVGLLTTARPEIDTIQYTILLVYTPLLLVAVTLMVMRLLRRRGKPVSVTYDGGIGVAGSAGMTVLEIGLAGDVPHAHVCGGRGRCGTCLVSITAQDAVLSRVGDIEAHTLKRIGAEPSTRLACQARLLEGAVEIKRLRPVHVDVQAARDPMAINTLAPTPSEELA